MLDAFAWALVVMGVLIFVIGAVGMIVPKVFQKPEDTVPPARWKFFLATWLLPPWPLAIAFAILARDWGAA